MCSTEYTSYTSTRCFNLLCKNSVLYIHSLHTGRISISSSTYAKYYNIVKSLFYTTVNALPDDDPVSSETRMSSVFKKYCCESNDSCVHLLVNITKITTIIQYNKQH